MRIAYNPKTGEYLGLQSGQWSPLRVAENGKGEKLYLGENGWEPLPSDKEETPDSKKMSTAEELVRGLGVGTRNVLEGLGDIPDTFLNQPVNVIGRLFGYDLGLGNPGTGLADLMGLPKAETDFEKLIAAAERGAAGALPTLAAGAVPAVAKAAPAYTPRRLYQKHPPSRGRCLSPRRPPRVYTNSSDSSAPWGG